MSVLNGKRITFKRTRPNPLFHDWLEELYEEAKQKGSKLEPMLQEALTSISKYPLPLESGAECAILKGFDKRLCLFIDKRLNIYKSSSNELSEDAFSKSSATSGSEVENDVINNINLQSSTDRIPSNNSPECNDNLPSTSTNSSSTKNKKRYKPALRSGCYAFLMVLINLKKNEAMSKGQLSAAAQKYCDKDISSEWKNMTRLIKKGLVNKSIENNIPRFSLTAEGISIAKELSKQNNKVDDIVINDNTANNYLLKNGSNDKIDVNDLLFDENKCCKVTVLNETNVKTIANGLPHDESKSETEDLLYDENKYSEVIATNDTKAKTITKGLQDNDKNKSEINHFLYDENKSSEVIVINDTEAETITNGLQDNDKNNKSEINNYLIENLRCDENKCSEVIVINDTKSHHIKTVLSKNIMRINGTRTLMHDICTNSEEIENHGDYSNFIELEAGSFDIVLLIDKAETSGLTKKNDPTVTLFNKYPELKHEYRSLKVGDFTWIARHKTNTDQELVLPYIVERKRMDDLGHSIKDGRFHEQKFRLRKCGLNHVIYMAENHGSNKHVGLPMQSLMQALANTRVHDGFKVHITESLAHSVRFLTTMTLRLMYEYKDKRLKGHNGEPKGDILMTFGHFNKSSVKNRALSVTETFIKLLLQLKGVSVEKALTITNVYKTPRMLIERYKCCDQKEGEMLLANLKFGELNRSIGPSVSKSVYQLFTFRNMK